MRINLLLGLITASLAVSCHSEKDLVDMSGIKNQYLDVAYANVSEAQKMDLYIPEGNSTFPAVVLVHGGGFASGDKASENVYAKKLVENGYVAATINYRLSGEAKFPANINDVKAAIRFLRANAVKYHIHPESIGIWGGSAGGNLSALAGTSGDVGELEDLSLGYAENSSRVQAVVDWSGPTDFIKMDEYFKESGLGEPTNSAANSTSSRVLGEQITKIPETVAKANPETYISEDDPAFFIEHGTQDGLVPTQESVIFAKNLKAVLGEDKVTLILLEGEGHGGPQFETTENLDKVIAFFDENLK